MEKRLGLMGIVQRTENQRFPDFFVTLQTVSRIFVLIVPFGLGFPKRSPTDSRFRGSRSLKGLSDAIDGLALHAA
jgi:hypothetical protein